MNRFLLACLAVCLCAGAACAAEAIALAEQLRYGGSARDQALSKLLMLNTQAADAVPVLLRHLKDEDADVRWAGAQALGFVRSRPKEAVPALIRALSDPDRPPEGGRPSVADAAAIALGCYGNDAAGAVPDLIAVAKGGKEVLLRRVCIVALGRIRSDPEKVVPLLRELLRSPEWRLEAALALGLFGEEAKDAIPDLFAVYQSKDVEDDARRKVTRSNVLRAVGGMGRYAVPHAPRLLKIFKDQEESEYLRVAALRALADMGPAAKECVPGLIECVNSRDYSHFDQQIIHCLVQIGDASVEPLITNLTTCDRSRQAPIMNTLRALDELGPKALPATPHLRAIWMNEKEDRSIRQQAYFLFNKFDKKP